MTEKTFGPFDMDCPSAKWIPISIRFLEPPPIVFESPVFTDRGLPIYQYGDIIREMGAS